MRLSWKQIDRGSTLRPAVRVVQALIGLVATLFLITSEVAAIVAMIQQEAYIIGGCIALAIGAVTFGAGRILWDAITPDRDPNAASSPGRPRRDQRTRPDGEAPRQVSPDEVHEKRERNVLRMARSKNGRLTVAELALESPLDIDASRAVLDELARKGVAAVEVTDSGHQVYVFPAFADGGRDKLSARSMLDEDAEVALEFENLAEEQQDKK